MCFSAWIVDTDVINLILTDVPDIDSRNAEQGLVPLMVSGLAGKRHAVKWFVRRGLLQPSHINKNLFQFIRIRP